MRLKTPSRGLIKNTRTLERRTSKRIFKRIYISIQHRLETSYSNSRKAEYIIKMLAHFIKTRDINRALRSLSETPDNGVLNLTDKVTQQINIKQAASLTGFFYMVQ